MKPYNSSPNSNHDPVQNLTEDQLGDYEIQTIDQSNQQQQQTQPKHPDVRLNTGEDLSKAGRSSKSHLSPFNLLVSEPYDSEAQLENLGLRNHPNTNSKVQESIDPSSFPGRPTGLHPLALPPLSIKQKLYIIFPQMIGAAIIDGAANFGIGCAMYLNAKNVRIWILKNNTVAGDMAVTIFIQGVATFCIASGMVHVELRKNKVKAFPYPWPDTSWGKTKPQLPENAKTRFGRIWRSFNNDHGLTRGLHFFSGSDVNDIFDSRLTWSQFFKRLAWSVWKGSVLSVLYFFILWPISIAIVSPIWAGENLGNGNYTAPIIKGIYGAVYGLLMNPVCAMIAMGSEDSVRHHRSEVQRKRFDHPEKEAMKTTVAERVSIVPSNDVANNYLNFGDGDDDECVTLNRNSQNLEGSRPRRLESLRRSLDTSSNMAGRLGSNTSFNERQSELDSGLAQNDGRVHPNRSKSSNSYRRSNGLALYSNNDSLSTEVNNLMKRNSLGSDQRRNTEGVKDLSDSVSRVLIKDFENRSIGVTDTKKLQNSTESDGNLNHQGFKHHHQTKTLLLNQTRNKLESLDESSSSSITVTI